MKHTPGPWNREMVHYRHAVVDNANTGEWKEIAVCHSEADAYLIAAAPELLASLERLFNCAGDFEEDSLAAALDQAIEAIKKAKGGSK